MSDGKLVSIEPRSGLLGRLEWKFPLFLLAVFGLLVPLLYQTGWYGIDDVNMWGRYMCFALIAIGLDLVSTPACRLRPRLVLGLARALSIASALDVTPNNNQIWKPSF